MTRSSPHEVLTVNPMFENGEEALKWAVEILRRRRVPQTSAFFKYLPEEAEFVAQIWEGRKNMTLPRNSEDRMGLALKVTAALEQVKGRDDMAGRLLHLWVWGDWADEGRLRAALAIQEKCRQEGVRVRIAYRYTYDQLAAMCGKDRKAVWRKVRDGLALLDEVLAGQGLLARVEVPSQMTDNFKKLIYLEDFKMVNE